MEPDRDHAIAMLKLRILGRESDKKRLQAVIAFSPSHERRTLVLADLADLLEEIRVAAEELARLEAEERSR
jgi:hypothetical protein